MNLVGKGTGEWDSFTVLLVDYRLDKMRFSGQVDVMDSMIHARSVRDVRASLHDKKEK